jgi:large subunit ribosomal protein L14e
MGLLDFVEPGRVAFINYGEDSGKLVVIVDMVDINRVLVDGLEHFPRVLYPLKRLTLTRLRMKILRGARTGTLKKAAKEFDLTAKWEKTTMY